MVLARDGTLTLRVADSTTKKDFIVGVSPGRTNEFKPVDLSTAAASTVAGGSGSTAVGERFAASSDVDFAALAKKFYKTHGDSFEQLVIWTDQRIVTDAFAFESTVANEITGIGVDIYDASGAFGSGGRLRSVVMMDAISKYPSDPTTKFNGENNTLSLIGQESGHRWLAFLGIKDASGAFSNVLLGRDDAHWSFFTDSDASVMEGNDIQDLGSGNFLTVGAVSRFSPLDQYAMGLRTEAEVPSFFYVKDPTNVSNSAQRDSAPKKDVRFTGTRVDVSIQQIVAAMGARVPSAAQSPRVHTQAFIHLVSAGRTTDAANVAKIDRFRAAWETFFLSATDGRMQANTRLK
jgi:hypothetical protein